MSNKQEAAKLGPKVRQLTLERLSPVSVEVEVSVTINNTTITIFHHFLFPSHFVAILQKICKVPTLWLNAIFITYLCL